MERSDRTPKPHNPEPGERDVWAVAEQCAKMKLLTTQQYEARLWLQGDYVVLWSDGQIERVPFKDRPHVKLDDKTWLSFYKGEAGVPKGEVITELELRRDWSGWEVHPD
jgi:hypothetical protein